jgi:hypothetical protein
MSNCHEKRLEPYNYFPTNLSDNKPIRMVNFDKNYARDNLLYRGVSCSDSLYDHHRHLNLNHKKEPGILQFARIGHKRGDDEKRLRKLMEFGTKQDAMSDILKDGFKNKTTKSAGAIKKGEKVPVREANKAVDF